MDELARQIAAQLGVVEEHAKAARKAAKAADIEVKKLHAMMQDAAKQFGPDMGVQPSVWAPKTPPE